MSCVNKGLLRIAHLYHDGSLLPLNLLNIAYDVNIPIMTYNSIISALPHQWRRYMANGVHKQTILSNFDKIENRHHKQISKHFYQQIIDKKYGGIDLVAKWVMHINLEHIDTKWFSLIDRLTIDNTLRSFQFRVLHRIIYFNDKLYIFGKVDKLTCDFCNTINDSFEHRLWTCDKTQDLWTSLTDWFNEKTNQLLTLTYTMIIGNSTNCDLLNIVILVTKYYIYKTFLGKNILSLPSLINEIRYIELIEKDIAVRKNKEIVHNTKWKMLSTLDRL